MGAGLSRMNKLNVKDDRSANVKSLVFSPEQIRHHAEFIKSRYSENPIYAARYLSELLDNNGYGDSGNPDIAVVKTIVNDLKELEESPQQEHHSQWVVSDFADGKEDPGAARTLDLVSKEIVFRKEIEEYYLPKQLVDAMLELGEIPKNSIESYVGIGFIDIADYTFLSKFLSPKENQVVLNGLYTAFNWVLLRHGGYLNKIEGDSLMFHFGGLIDPKIKDMEQDEVMKYIGKEIFYTCIEMQRVCVLFNQANDKFIYEEADKRTKEALKYAFDIISTLRNNLDLSSSMNALFQIRIRIGANLGVVTIGNFGPDGAKQWDVVGMPVIHAKRMEATAPIGGLRISEDLYKVLEKYGVVEAYFTRFKREAQLLGGYFKDITKEELFKFGKVVLKDKKNAEFLTYSIQVNPGLPESIADQIELLLDKGNAGTDKILELLQYYRGNSYVITAVEDMLKRHNIQIRKDQIIRVLYPKKYNGYFVKLDRDDTKTAEYINGRYSLFLIFQKLGHYQDRLKIEYSYDGNLEDFTGHPQYMQFKTRRVREEYKIKKKNAVLRTYFYNVVYPLVFEHIRAVIFEYQHSREAEDVLEVI